MHSKSSLILLGLLAASSSSSAAPPQLLSPRDSSSSTTPGKLSLFPSPKCPPRTSILAPKPQTHLLYPDEQTCQPLSPAQGGGGIESLSVLAPARCPDPTDPSSSVEADILLFASPSCTAPWSRRIPGHLLPLILAEQPDAEAPLCISRVGYLPDGEEVGGFMFACPPAPRDEMEEPYFADAVAPLAEEDEGGREEVILGGKGKGGKGKGGWLDAAIDEMNRHSSDDDEPEPGPGESEGQDPDYGAEAEERWRDIPVVIIVEPGARPVTKGKGKGGKVRDEVPEHGLPGKERPGEGRYGGSVPWVVIVLVVMALLVADMLKVGRMFNGVLALFRRRRGDIALE